MRPVPNVAAAAAATAVMPGLQAGSEQPHARSTAQVEVPAATDPATHGREHSQDGLRMGRKWGFIEAWRRLHTFSRRPKLPAAST